MFNWILLYYKKIVSGITQKGKQFSKNPDGYPIVSQKLFSGRLMNNITRNPKKSQRHKIYSRKENGIGDCSMPNPFGWPKFINESLSREET